MNKNIVLVGLSGSGKTTIGKILNNYTNYTLIDTDAIIEEKESRTINNIFATDGEEYFRDIETQIAEEVSIEGNQIISTGGGIVLRKENLDNLKRNGIIFYLKTTVEVLLKRLEGDNSRPLLKTKDVKKKLENMFRERNSLYEEAEVIIETDKMSAEETAKEILRIYNEKCQSRN